jgi:hypothetical protein
METQYQLARQALTSENRSRPSLALLAALGVVVVGAADRLYANPPSPFAVEVVEYVPGTGVGSDWISGDPYDNPATALGRPTVDTTGDDWFIPVDEPVPVVPVYPPFRAFEVVTIGYDGYLVLAFDHAVRNDPDNPYGLDFIIFGCASLTLSDNEFWTNDNPNDVIIDGTNLFSEPGLVSVSQDGLTWYTYAEGPYADDFAPTLGRLYDPNNPDPSLGEWNEWWGAPTDPTLPLDPDINVDALAGLTVAQAAQLYDGSAGGTAFDIGVFGLDWIQYVRIENADLGGTPEIDAVVDVAPGRLAPVQPNGLSHDLFEPLAR